MREYWEERLACTNALMLDSLATHQWPGALVTHMYDGRKYSHSGEARSLVKFISVFLGYLI